MKASRSKVTKGLNQGSLVATCDNSGAKLVKIVNVKLAKTVKRRISSAGIGDLMLVSVKKGTKEMVQKQLLKNACNKLILIHLPRLSVGIFHLYSKSQSKYTTKEKKQQNHSWICIWVFCFVWSEFAFTLVV